MEKKGFGGIRGKDYNANCVLELVLITLHISPVLEAKISEESMSCLTLTM